MATLFERLAQHLFPDGEAWDLTIPRKLRDYIFGIFAPLEIVKDQWFDRIWSDIFPSVTSQRDLWQQQFGLSNIPIGDADQINQLDAEWKALGGQDPFYLQATLQQAGFNVYVHEWWIPGTEPPVGVDAVPGVKNPFLYLNDESGNLQYLIVCNNTQAVCGFAGAVCGASANAKGYPLVNKIRQVRADIIDCGDPQAVCGFAGAVCGASSGFKIEQRRYTIPTNTDSWNYFLYWGGENFPDLANIPANRKDEFERLLLKLCPTEQWLGILVNYT